MKVSQVRKFLLGVQFKLGHCALKKNCLDRVWTAALKEKYRMPLVPMASTAISLHRNVLNLNFKCNL